MDTLKLKHFSVHFKTKSLSKIYWPNYTHVDFHNFQTWHIWKYSKSLDLDKYIKTIFWVH